MCKIFVIFFLCICLFVPCISEAYEIQELNGVWNCDADTTISKEPAIIEYFNTTPDEIKKYLDTLTLEFNIEDKMFVMKINKDNAIKHIIFSKYEKHDNNIIYIEFTNNLLPGIMRIAFKTKDYIVVRLGNMIEGEVRWSKASTYYHRKSR